MAHTEHSINIICINDEDSYLNMPRILNMRSSFLAKTNPWTVTWKPVPTGVLGKKKKGGDRTMFLVLENTFFIVWQITDLLGTPEGGTFRKIYDSFSQNELISLTKIFAQTKLMGHVLRNKLFILLGNQSISWKSWLAKCSCFFLKILFFIHENNIIVIKYLLSLYLVRETVLRYRESNTNELALTSRFLSEKTEYTHFTKAMLAIKG